MNTKKYSWFPISRVRDVLDSKILRRMNEFTQNLLHNLQEHMKLTEVTFLTEEINIDNLSSK